METLGVLEALAYRVENAGADELPELATELAQFEAAIRGLEAKVMVRAALLGGSAVEPQAVPETIEALPKFVDTKEAARRLGLKEATLRKWRVLGRGPLYRRHGGSVRYAVRDLEEWSAEAERRHTSEEPQPRITPQPERRRGRR